jgi:hypothetical protein
LAFKLSNCIIFEVFVAVGIEIVVVQIMTLCVLVNGWQHFRKTRSLHLCGSSETSFEKVAGYKNRPLGGKKEKEPEP